MNTTSAAPQSKEQLAAALFAMVREVIPRKLQDGFAITPQTELADLGINSMAKISLAFKMEERLGIDVSRLGEAMADVRTVQDVIDLVERAVAQ
ncbi:acyl carrier protein [Ramlibacter sp.]|uniref:acyl carrier protein n=1 Tax=Ramlibacter sp. TaxID=1917967 RepID=UPI0018240D88|nr:acyl carrier protein [Ramlibacter sp.]MBA2676739.1 acyl carrier protein [Ramlibacter sp.]